MRLNIFCCILTFTLGSHVTADLIHDVVEEKRQIIMYCPQSMEGSVTWSREIDGAKVDILTDVGDSNIIHIKDPLKRYNTLANKALVITRLNVPDSGRYLCDNQPAMELTVIPSGTKTKSVTKRSNISLKCPHDVGGCHDPTWSREIAGKQQPMRGRVSTVDKTLTIRNVKATDFGLYFCDGKAAVYLNVTKREKFDRDGTRTSLGITHPTTIKTTMRTTNPTTASAITTTELQPILPSYYSLQMLVRMIIGLLYLIIMISIISVTRKKAQQIQKQKRPSSKYENDF